MGVNTGVAWWSAIVHQRAIEERIFGDTHAGNGKTTGHWPPTDPAILSWPVPVPKEWPRTPERVMYFRTWESTETSASATAGPGRFDLNLAVLTEYGWPFRSLGEWWRGTSMNNSRMSRGGYIALPNSTRWPYLWMVPIRPAWPGFALNTIFYAALAWGLWQVPLAIRRRRRGRAGKCVQCGYDLAGLTSGSHCPECGPAR